MVIVLAGVLAAIAIPRFADLSPAAHKSSVAATAAAFRTGVVLVRAAFLVAASSGAVDNVVGFGSNDVDVNTSGYPTDTSGANTITGTGTCTRVWTGILQHPPTTTTTTSTAFDYRVTRAGQVCTYTYRRSTSPTRSIVYNATNGAVTINNP